MKWLTRRSLRYLFLVAVLPASSQQTLPSSTQPPIPLATEAFELYHNRVYLNVKVNGHEPISMVVDTGAALSGLSEETAGALHLAHKGHAQLNGNGDITSHISLAKDLTFQIGAATLPEKVVAIVPYVDLKRLEGRRIGGVLGVEFFRRYVIVIDYPGQTLAIYEPDSFVYKGNGTVIPLTFGRGTALFHVLIRVSSQDTVPANLAVDSGTYTGLRLYSPFVRKHETLLNAFPLLNSYGFGVGGEFPEKLGRVQSLQIGALELREPVASFPAAEHGATASDLYDGTIGGGILSHFKVIFDYSRHRLIFEPGPQSFLPFGSDTSGLVLQADLPIAESAESRSHDVGTISVRHVLAETPAALAGFQPGDTVVSMDGRPADELGMEAIRLRLFHPDVYQFQLMRGGKPIELTLKTSALLY